MAHMQSTPTPYGKDIKVKVDAKGPKDSDYILRSIEIRPAKNTDGGQGVIVECHHELKDEVRKKRRESEIYGGEYREPEKYIAANYDDGIDFIIGKLQKMKADSKKKG